MIKLILWHYNDALKKRDGYYSFLDCSSDRLSIRIQSSEALICNNKKTLKKTMYPAV